MSLKIEIIITHWDGSVNSTFLEEKKVYSIGDPTKCELGVLFCDKVLGFLERKDSRVLIKKVNKNSRFVLDDGAEFDQVILKDSSVLKILGDAIVEFKYLKESRGTIDDMSKEFRVPDTLFSDDPVELKKTEIHKDLPGAPSLPIEVRDTSSIIEEVQDKEPTPPMVEISEVQDVVAPEEARVTSYFAKHFLEEFRAKELEANYLDYAYLDGELKEDELSEDSSTPFFEQGESECLWVYTYRDGTMSDVRHFTGGIVYVSNSKPRKDSIFLASHTNAKEKIADYRDGKYHLSSLFDYDIYQKFSDGIYEKRELEVSSLASGEHYCFVHRNHEIEVFLGKEPPSFMRVSDRYSREERKILLLTLLAFFIPLFAIVIAVDVPDIIKKKKEIIVVYKPEKKIKKKVKKKTEQQSSSSSNTKKTPEKKTEKVTTKSPPKKAPKTKVAKKKKSTVKKTLKKTRMKKVSKVQKSVKKAKKVYNFNFASKLKATSGSSYELASVSSKGTVQKSSASASLSNSNFRGGNIKVGKGELSNLNAEVFKGSALGGISGESRGAEGLSGKRGYDFSNVSTETKVLGAIDPNLIRKIMEENIPRFRHCYQKELLLNSKLKSSFDLSFVINRIGRGKNVSVNKQMGFSRKGITCLKRVISLIQFPKPRGGGVVDITQPFNFEYLKE